MDSTNNSINTNEEILKEIAEYRFPDQGGEYVSSQIERHQYIVDNVRFHKNSQEMKQYLLDNEEISMNGNNPVITGTKLGSPSYYYTFANSPFLSDRDKDWIADPTKDTFIGIIYHADFDGSVSGAICGKLFSKFMSISNPNKILLYTSYNYTNKTINALAAKAKQRKDAHRICFVVDIRLSEDDLILLLKVFERIVWIDHHQMSIETAAKVDLTKFNLRDVTICLDTRYSATYLCYALLKDLVKAQYGMEIDEAFPAFVSMVDTQTFFNPCNPKWLNIKVTKDILNTFQGRDYIVRPDQKSYYKLKPSDTNLIGKTIYMRNYDYCHYGQFQNGYQAGLKLNRYFIDMGCMEPYSPFYDNVFTDRNTISQMIDIGDKLLVVAREKAAIQYENETMYQCSYMGWSIKGITGMDSGKFTAEKTAIPVKLTMKINAANIVLVNVKTTDNHLKRANIGELMKNVFDVTAGGHPGIGVAKILITSIEKFEGWLQTNTLPESIKKEFPDLAKIYKNAKWTISTGKDFPRFNEIYLSTFKVVSSVVLAAWQKSTQEAVEYYSKTQHFDY